MNLRQISRVSAKFLPKYGFRKEFFRTHSMMSSEADQLHQRAEAADKIIDDLRCKIAAIKDNYVQHAGQGLEERLIQENEQLRAELASLKQQLTFVEVRNGVKQVPMPSVTAQPVAAVVPAVAGQAPSSAADNAPQEGAKKEKKQKNKKDDGEVKTKPAAGGGDDKPIDVSRLDLRVGLIEAVEKHPDADTLYVETVNVGTDKPRTIVSGLVKHVQIEEMRNKKAIFMCNLKPAKMRGILSEGMVMCASSPDKVEIIHIPQDAQPGTRITCTEYTGEPDDLLAPKKKIWEQVAPDLKIDQNGVATYKGAPLRLNGEVFKAPTLTNVQIK